MVVLSANTTTGGKGSKFFTENWILKLYREQTGPGGIPVCASVPDLDVNGS